MPRKPPKLSIEDLDAIISGEWVDSLIDWARDEKERRAKAGKGGGRPKKTELQKAVEPILNDVRNHETPTLKKLGRPKDEARKEVLTNAYADLVEKAKVWSWFGGARFKDGIWVRDQRCGKDSRRVQVGGDDHEKIIKVLGIGRHDEGR